MTPLYILEKMCNGVTRTAVLQDGQLMEYITSDAASSLVGTVYLGRVERVLPDVRAAFIKIGRPKNGFLPLKESDSFHALNGNASLMSGQQIIVQVQKDEKGDKGVFLTRDISLPGQFMILMPLNRFVGVSKRITDGAERKLLTETGKLLADNRFGLIMRQAALYAKPDELNEEAEALYSSYTTIAEHAYLLKAPVVLQSRDNDADQAAKDYSSRHQVTLLSQTEHQVIPNVETRTIDSEELGFMWRENRILQQAKEANCRKVCLPEGASLIIDEREALHTIDVNSGSNTFSGKDTSLAFHVNLEACSEIARQIRLRNLSGIILIDFIDMNTEAQRIQVMVAMQSALQYDRVKTVIHGFTRLGLLEMTRKRSRSLLSDEINEFGIQ